MNISPLSDILILIFAATIQILIGVALIRAGQKFYKKSAIEQSGIVFWKMIGVIISIWGWGFTLWSIVYTVTQIIKIV